MHDSEGAKSLDVQRTKAKMKGSNAATAIDDLFRYRVAEANPSRS